MKIFFVLIGFFCLFSGVNVADLQKRHSWNIHIFLIGS